MLVIKRKGNIQEFDIGKVEISIVNSADDIGYILTQGDISTVLNQFKRRLSELTKDGRNTSACEIRGLVYYVLRENGFRDVVKSYMKIT